MSSSFVVKGLVSDDDWWVTFIVYHPVLLITSVIWNNIKAVESLFFMILTNPLIFDVTASIVSRVDWIKSLGVPTLEEMSIYILVAVVCQILLILNLPSPGSAELTFVSILYSNVAPPNEPSLPWYPWNPWKPL